MTTWKEAQQFIEVRIPLQEIFAVRPMSVSARKLIQKADLSWLKIDAAQGDAAKLGLFLQARADEVEAYTGKREMGMDAWRKLFPGAPRDIDGLVAFLIDLGKKAREERKRQRACLLAEDAKKRVVQASIFAPNLVEKEEKHKRVQEALCATHEKIDVKDIAPIIGVGPMCLKAEDMERFENALHHYFQAGRVPTDELSKWLIPPPEMKKEDFERFKKALAEVLDIAM